MPRTRTSKGFLGTQNQERPLLKWGEHENVYIPEIVFEEVVKSRNDNFISDLDKLKSRIEKLTSMPCCDFERIKLPSDEFDYRYFLKGKILEYIKSRKFIYILSLEREHYISTLEIIIKKAIDKRKPFKNGDKDDGVKDALIWETILNCNTF